tara:strand:+ start:2584 stop:2916 length:333 start_codon:yes stop_codon:yes gene_type:complete
MLSGLFFLVQALLLLVAGLGAWWLGARSGRSAALEVYAELVHDISEGSVKNAALRDEVVEFFERTEKARNRARSAQAAAERAAAKGPVALVPSDPEQAAMIAEAQAASAP